MITVQEAQKLILKYVTTDTPLFKNVEEALDSYLAEDIIAPISLPPFNQSAMDGYAFRFDDVLMDLKVIDQIPAGEYRTFSVNKGEAVRIFTGSKVPDSCDTVVMQELTKVDNGMLKVIDEGLKKGGNIRKESNQLKKGELVLKQGTKITAATVGFLAAMGIRKINVYPIPKVAIIATGNELAKPGNRLKSGQIYESNTWMLKAALNKMGINPIIEVIEDHQQKTIKAIEIALKNNELVLLSGGISVGDYDFVKVALEKNNVQEIFYKINQKPGKPLYFGKTQSTYVFALPGNPAAALTCFYEYAFTAIQLMKGVKHPQLTKLFLESTSSYKKKQGRPEFLKGITDFKTVTILDGQGSGALLSFAKANCLVCVSEEINELNKGEIVEVHLLPQ